MNIKEAFVGVAEFIRETAIEIDAQGRSKRSVFEDRDRQLHPERYKTEETPEIPNPFDVR